MNISNLIIVDEPGVSYRISNIEYWKVPLAAAAVCATENICFQARQTDTIGKKKFFVCLDLLLVIHQMHGLVTEAF